MQNQGRASYDGILRWFLGYPFRKSAVHIPCVTVSISLSRENTRLSGRRDLTATVIAHT